MHNLIHQVHKKKPLDYIFFPMLDCLLIAGQDPGRAGLPDRGRHPGGGEGVVDQGR